MKSLLYKYIYRIVIHYITINKYHYVIYYIDISYL
jgi:hypothetical protein